MKKQRKKPHQPFLTGFEPLSAEALNELCAYESWLPELPNKLFYPGTALLCEKQARIRLRACLKKAISISNN